MYRHGEVDLVEGLDPATLTRLKGFPKDQVITSSQAAFPTIEFNRGTAALSAQANAGVSVFADLGVRKAFIEAFDRCAAVRAVVSITNCTDSNLHTDELTAPPSPDYDPTVHLPSYNLDDAAKLMDRAGYPVVDGIRRLKDGKTPLHLAINTLFPGDAPYELSVKMAQDWHKSLQVDVTVVASGVLASPPPDDIDVFIEFFSADLVGRLPAQSPGQEDPKVIALDREGAQISNDQQRDQVYRELQRYVASQYYAEPLHIQADVTLTKPTLCNFKKWPQVRLNTWNIADWYVAPSCPSLAVPQVRSLSWIAPNSKRYPTRTGFPGRAAAGEGSAH